MCEDQAQWMTGPGDRKRGLVRSRPMLAGVGHVESVFSACVQDSHSGLRGLGLPGAPRQSPTEQVCPWGGEESRATDRPRPQSTGEPLRSPRPLRLVVCRARSGQVIAELSGLLCSERGGTAPAGPCLRPCPCLALPDASLF